MGPISGMPNNSGENQEESSVEKDSKILTASELKIYQKKETETLEQKIFILSEVFIGKKSKKNTLEQNINKLKKKLKIKVIDSGNGHLDEVEKLKKIILSVKDVSSKAFIKKLVSKLKKEEKEKVKQLESSVDQFDYLLSVKVSEKIQIEGYLNSLFDKSLDSAKEKETVGYSLLEERYKLQDKIKLADDKIKTEKQNLSKNIKKKENSFFSFFYKKKVKKMKERLLELEKKENDPIENIYEEIAASKIISGENANYQLYLSKGKLGAPTIYVKKIPKEGTVSPAGTFKTYYFSASDNSLKPMAFLSFKKKDSANKEIEAAEVQNKLAQKIKNLKGNEIPVYKKKELKPFSVGTESGDSTVLVMDNLSGKEVEELMKKQSLSEEQVNKIAANIAATLQVFHSMGYAHLDLKPANTVAKISESGEVEEVGVIDYGFATEIDADKGLTIGQCGSPRYMSPEVYYDCQLTLESDIYSLGAMMIEMLHAKGKGLEEAENKVALLIGNRKYLVNFIDDFIDLFSTPGTKDYKLTDLDKVCIQCMTIERKNRPTAKEVLFLLSHAGSGGESSSKEFIEKLEEIKNK